MPGLQLAANDSLRGVLTPEQLRGILDAVSGVVVDLAEEKDGTRPGRPRARPGPANSAVLCVSGRGPLDEAVCAMLAQVLGKRGLRARVVSNEAVSRGHIATLDVTGVADDLRVLYRGREQRVAAALSDPAAAAAGAGGDDHGRALDGRSRAAHGRADQRGGGRPTCTSIRCATRSTPASPRPEQPVERPEMAA